VVGWKAELVAVVGGSDHAVPVAGVLEDQNVAQAEPFHSAAEVLAAGGFAHRLVLVLWRRVLPLPSPGELCGKG